MQSYDLAPAPPLYPLSGQQVVSLSQSSCVSLLELTDGEMDREKAWSSKIIQ